MIARSTLLAILGVTVFPLALVPVTRAPVRRDGSSSQQRAGGEWTPETCELTPEGPTARVPFLQQVATAVTPVTDVTQCPAPQPGDICGPYCIVDIKESTVVAGRDPRQVLKDALLRCNTAVRLGPDIVLDFADLSKDWFPIEFGRCVTLTSVNDFKSPTTQGRTPRTPGPELNYGPHRQDGDAVFFEIGCDSGDRAPSDHVRVSGFRLFGPSIDQQTDLDAGISIRRCRDIEVFNTEIAGWGAQGIVVRNTPVDLGDPASVQAATRINDFDQVRIHDNFIHHNQHPSTNTARGYGVETSYVGARAHIYRNVFDFNRHAISADGRSGGYVAEENLVLKGGGWHGKWYESYTHIFDVHGTDQWCFLWLCATGFGGQAGEEFRFYRNSFQYRSGNAIKIRGWPRDGAYFVDNIFPHDTLDEGWIWQDFALDLVTPATTKSGNIVKTDTFGEYYSQCDFDADDIDDLFLATGATWWYSSSGTFHWSFLNTSSKRLKDLRFGYFDDDDRCDVLSESGGPGRWAISSGGTGPWTPLEQIWPQPLDKDPWKPLEDVQFGRFDPSDHRHSRRTTHAFYRGPHGEWFVKKLSEPNSDWEYVGGSTFSMNKLRFGDFNGDGVTDVLAIDKGHWAYSESARTRWQPLNRSLSDPVKDLFIANMDRDDTIDDILRLEVSQGSGNNIDVVWRRSKNGVDRWKEFKRYSFEPTSTVRGEGGGVEPKLGFVGRFGAVSGGTLVIDTRRVGHFFVPGNARLGDLEWKSRFAY